MSAYPFTHYLVAKDDAGKPFIWGFMSSLEAAKRALLPETWVIDEKGNKLAERAS